MPLIYIYDLFDDPHRGWVLGCVCVCVCFLIGPTEIKVGLEYLGLQQPLAKSYEIHDVWTDKVIGSVTAADGYQLTSGTLRAHQTRLYILKPSS